MTFKPATWYPIAVALSAINLVAVWFAAQPGEPWHATLHAGLAVAFGLWARRLREGPAGGALEAGLDALELEVVNLRQELNEAQDRLDFTERLLAQGSDPRRAEPLRQGPE